ncbi:hypothetical protein ACPFT9_003346 [Vibrio cholerae]|uniref:Uncharacterized protein n=1 Tax=Vibrio vulnificus TaxID=672 RepID=A0AAW4HAU3_VIBVL|nr:hypothetical protein [Vibrio vulnificus]EHZ7431664.1 hypothetical protein [Vibrio cholerae]HCG9584474.1 hypothetical protein [Vibrio parahaemolyticus]EJL6364776.1 hypothetical protein [Vibrio cholerae]ELF1354408.1 hypothetical protein [Vibrio cholerae]MBN8122298.1 hypothetical protein [Vibrio vulnificus]
MSGLTNIPNPIDNTPINVVERKVREVDCPNPKCDHKLDITSINYGTKIQCNGCSNVTWTPAYHPKWWQKTKGFALSIIVSLVVGVMGSLIATSIWEHYNNPQSDTEQTSG